MNAFEIFYIDPDEEISSIVSRLKLSKASFLIFVIPHRAVLFSSVITMRLFKKEADRLEKDVFVITQDEQGFDMTRRVGFIARKSLDELPFSAESSEEREKSFGGEENVLVRNESALSKKRIALKGDIVTYAKQPKKDCFERNESVFKGFGNHSFSDSSFEDGARKETQKRNNDILFLEPEISADNVSPGASRKIRSVASELVSASNRELPNENVSAYGYAPEVSRKERYPFFEKPKPDREKPYFLKERGSCEDDAIGSSMWNGGNERRAKSFFSIHEAAAEDPKRKRETTTENKLGIREILSQKKESVHGNEKIGSRVQWIVIFSFLIILGMMVCIGMYLQGSEADIAVHLKRQNVSGDVSYQATEGNGDIPIRFFEYEDVVTVSGNATGLGSSSGAKARGTVILYNAFSREAQPLVATTRLQTPDGQVFRIARSVSIPGLTEQNGQVQPGSVRVDVQADESGERGNIEPTKFTIPGFSGGPKFEKMYAESEEKMTGGGSENVTNRVISQRDVADAKKNIEQTIRNSVIEKAKTDTDSGIALNDLIDIVFTKETSVPTVGTVAKTFDFSAKVQVRYAVFSGADARETAMEILKEKGAVQQQSVLDENSVSLEYGKMSMDFEKKIIDMKMFATGSVSLQPSLEDIRNDLLGKDESEIRSIAEKYPQVDRIEVQLKKSYFQNTIPEDPEKVKITISGN